MVQVPVHQVVDVITMRHRGVTTARTMGVSRVMTSAGVRRGAVCRIGRGHRHGVLVHVVAVGVVHVAVVQIVDMTVVLDAWVPTSGSVGVVVIGMRGAVCAHQEPLIQKRGRKPG